MTSAAEFDTGDMWRIEQWVESLNDLGFDIDEMDIVTEPGGSQVRLQPRVVEAGHHSRELRTLTGLDVEEGQARRLLNDIARYSAYLGLGTDKREEAANRWLTEVYEPLVAMIPRSLRGRLEPAEVFHEVLAAPLVPLRARRARGGHLRCRARLHRDRARDEAGGGARDTGR